MASQRKQRSLGDLTRAHWETVSNYMPRGDADVAITPVAAIRPTVNATLTTRYELGATELREINEYESQPRTKPSMGPRQKFRRRRRVHVDGIGDHLDIDA